MAAVVQGFFHYHERLYPECALIFTKETPEMECALSAALQ
jgi:hypothetical protein